MSSKSQNAFGPNKWVGSILRGSAWTVVGQVIPLIASVVATPIVIRTLTTEGYGVFVLVGLIPSYLGFADFGMGLASTRFGSEAFSRDDFRSEAIVVRTASLIATMTSFPFASFQFFYAAEIIGFFDVPSTLQNDAILALKINSVTFVVSLWNGIFNTPQLDRLRMDLNTLVNSGFRTVGIVTVPLVLFLDGGLAGATLTLMMTAIATLIGQIVISQRLLPELVSVTIDRALVVPLLRFGGALAFSGVAAMLLVNIEKAILGSMVSTNALAYYNVAFTFVSMVTVLSASMIQSVIPVFAQLQGKSQDDELGDLVRRGTRLTVIWIWPVLMLFSVAAQPVFQAWAGEDFGRESVKPFYVMLMGVCVNAFSYLPYSVLIAKGRTDIIAKLYWLELPFYLFAVWFLISKLGILGAAIGWTVRIIVDAVALMLLARSVSGIRFEIATYYMIFWSITISVVPFALNVYLGQPTAMGVTITALFLSFFAVFAWRRVLTIDERRWVHDKFK